MSKILFIVKSINVTVLDTHMWLNGTLIKNMSDTHLHNACIWCWSRHTAEEGAGIGHIKMQNLTYKDWFLILKEEKTRRERVKIQSRIAELEELKLELLPKKQQRKVKLKEINEELERLRPDSFR